jgi:hypothetical protein
MGRLGENHGAGMIDDPFRNVMGWYRKEVALEKTLVIEKSMRDAPLKGANRIAGAIVCAGFLVALSICLMMNIEFIPLSYPGVAPIAIKHNRWTGEARVCSVDPDTMGNPNSFIGATYSCSLK